MSVSEIGFTMDNPLSVLQEILMKSKHVQNAAVVDCRSNRVKAETLGFNLTFDDIANLQLGFKNPMHIREKGLDFNKRLYTVIRSEPEILYGKFNKAGIIVKKTNHFMIIATYNTGMYAAVCIEAVDKLASYLKFKNK